MSIYPRTNYEMTEADLAKILDACKPTIVMKIGNSTDSSPQENANRAWQQLGEKMGFDYMTVQPAPGGDRFFTAIPSETLEQRCEREAREAEVALRAKIERLKAEIAEREAALTELLKP